MNQKKSMYGLDQLTQLLVCIHRRKDDTKDQVITVNNISKFIVNPET